MTYTVDATDPTRPLDSDLCYIAAELRAIKAQMIAIEAASETLIAASNVKPGTIIAQVGAVPSGYLELLPTTYDVSRTTYAALFATIGVTFGAGDGSTTFTLPGIAAGYTLIAGTPGSSSVGAVIAHTHTEVGEPAIISAGYGGGAPIRAGVPPSVATGSTGGTDNLAAGLLVRYCIKT